MIPAIRVRAVWLRIHRDRNIEKLTIESQPRSKNWIGGRE